MGGGDARVKPAALAAGCFAFGHKLPPGDTGALIERENATCKQRLRSSVAAEPRVELIATLGGAIADRIYDGLIEDLAHLRGMLASALGTIGANASS